MEHCYDTFRFMMQIDYLFITVKTVNMRKHEWKHGLTGLDDNELGILYWHTECYNIVR